MSDESLHPSSFTFQCLFNNDAQCKILHVFQTYLCRAIVKNVLLREKKLSFTKNWSEWFFFFSLISNCEKDFRWNIQQVLNTFIRTNLVDSLSLRSATLCLFKLMKFHLNQSTFIHFYLGSPSFSVGASIRQKRQICYSFKNVLSDKEILCKVSKIFLMESQKRFLFTFVSQRSCSKNY